ncbi:MAG: hypothetical protein P8N52_05375 [Crocinitomicaceae bacterium]|nr:hypothetical protein [Crocinitomicaceae bacterium]MDG1776839.1 hypothetical protein [Crocinitomicaceae bacterium]
MKLDYIDELNGFGDNMVRLFDFDMAESILFRDALINFISSDSIYLKLADLEFVEPRNCTLVLFKSNEDEGIISEDDENFFCALTVEKYQNMIQLLAPFCKKETKGYQFLYEVDSLTDFLFSPAGTW